ncbi:hypothetical protein [Kitasatospora sp. NPDC050463]|uniref:hypothetical protein n=1 Tax=Kitasatospora sp. NPDC050463 TaxID=3155786 RepID=UPI0033D18DDA
MAAEGIHDSQESLEADVAEFSTHDRKGGWARAHLVARRIEPGEGSGVGIEQESTKWFGRTTFRRISAREFARQAHTTHKRVMAFYDAWNRAAADGLVPPAEDLAPDEYVDLPEDLGATPFFGEKGYYRSYEAREVAGARVRAIEEEAERAGIKPTTPVLMATQPAALRTAVVADATARTAAMEGIAEYERREVEREQLDRDAAALTTREHQQDFDQQRQAEIDQAAQQVREATKNASEPDRALQVFKEMTTVRLATLRALSLLQQHPISFSEDRSAAIAELCDQAAAALSFIRDMATSSSTALNDAALRAFLDESEKLG